MRLLFAITLLLVGLPALADDHATLYQAAGWPEQRAHFNDALSAAQQRYQQTLPPAPAVFSLDGPFVGLVADNRGGVTIIPADTLSRLAAAAPAASRTHGEIDIEVEPLTPALARASGASKGVMVSYVAPPVAAGRDILSGDVIQSVDGIGVTTVAGFQQVAQSRKPGTEVTLELVRRGEPLKVAVPVVESGTSGTTRNGSGVVLRTVAGIGCEVVALAPGSPAARAGLRRGDLIVALDGRPGPDAARLQRALSASDPAQAVLLTIRRDLQHHVIAVEPR